MNHVVYGHANHPWADSGPRSTGARRRRAMGAA